MIPHVPEQKLDGFCFHCLPAFGPPAEHAHPRVVWASCHGFSSVVVCRCVVVRRRRPTMAHHAPRDLTVFFVSPPKKSFLTNSSHHRLERFLPLPAKVSLPYGVAALTRILPVEDFFGKHGWTRETGISRFESSEKCFHG